jgi:hypothetical protein
MPAGGIGCRRYERPSASVTPTARDNAAELHRRLLLSDQNNLLFRHSQNSLRPAQRLHAKSTPTSAISCPYSTDRKIDDRKIEDRNITQKKSGGKRHIVRFSCLQSFCLMIRGRSAKPAANSGSVPAGRRAGSSAAKHSGRSGDPGSRSFQIDPPGSLRHPARRETYDLPLIGRARAWPARGTR